MKVLCLVFMLHGSVDSLSTHPISNHFTETGIFQKYSLKLVNANANTFGYEIYVGDKLFIRQLTVPGMPGNKGFQRKKDAEKVAKLVVEKLSKGIVPPTIEKKEMDQLHIKY